MKGREFPKVGGGDEEHAGATLDGRKRKRKRSEGRRGITKLETGVCVCDAAECRWGTSGQRRRKKKKEEEEEEEEEEGHV